MFHTWRTRLAQLARLLDMLVITAVSVFGLVFLAILVA